MFRSLCALIGLATSLQADAAAFPVARCVNLGAALEAPSEGDWGYRIEQAHLTRIADAGFDTIRLPVRFSAYWDGQRLDPGLLRRVDEVIGWALDRDLNVIVDLHHYWELMENPDAHAADLIAIWAALSDHFRGADRRILFDLLNEPEGALTTAAAERLYAQITRTIRTDHPTRWIITGGDGWNSIEAMLDMTAPGPFEIRTFHYYAPWDFTHQQATYLDQPPPPRGWGSPADLDRLAADFGLAATASGPVFLGEFGVFDLADPADKVRWLGQVRHSAESHGMPWCVWSFSQGGAPGFSIFDVTRDDWMPGVLPALMGSIETSQ